MEPPQQFFYYIYNQKQHKRFDVVHYSNIICANVGWLCCVLFQEMNWIELSLYVLLGSNFVSRTMRGGTAIILLWSAAIPPLIYSRMVPADWIIWSNKASLLEYGIYISDQYFLPCLALDISIETIVVSPMVNSFFTALNIFIIVSQQAITWTKSNQMYVALWRH